MVEADKMFDIGFEPQARLFGMQESSLFNATFVTPLQVKGLI